MSHLAMSKRRALRWLSLGAVSGVGSWLSGCSSAPTKNSQSGSPAPQMVADKTPRPHPSDAHNPKEYRKDAARHLYANNANRIYSGKLPPLIYAVAVLRLNLNEKGDLMDIDWMRQPTHAPEVVAEIERTVRAASPFPAAQRLGPVLYTETWLWDKSGRFQLDTLTEGQT
jgi:hypothetical protein